MQYTCTGHACLYRGGVHAVHLHSACVPARGPVPSAMPRVAPQLPCSCQSCGTNRAVPIVCTSTNAPAPSSLSFSSSRSARPVRSPSVATRVARTRTASAAQLPQLPVLSQLSQIDQSSPNPASLQGLKVWESLKSVAYPTLYPLTVRLFLVFSTGRRMFEPEL